MRGREGKSPHIGSAKWDRSSTRSYSVGGRAGRRKQQKSPLVPPPCDPREADRPGPRSFRGFPGEGSHRPSQEEERDEQEDDSSAHRDDQGQGTLRRDDDPDASRKDQGQPQGTGEEAGLSLSDRHFLAQTPSLGGPRRTRLHAPGFERPYLMPPSSVVRCTRVLYGPLNGPEVHGREARPRLDARREGRSRRPPRARGEHQESHEGRGAVRTAPWEEPRHDFREGVDSDARLLRGRHDSTGGPRPLPEPERPANRTRRDDRRHREGP